MHTGVVGSRSSHVDLVDHNGFSNLIEEPEQEPMTEVFQWPRGQKMIMDYVENMLLCQLKIKKAKLQQNICLKSPSVFKSLLKLLLKKINIYIYNIQLVYDRLWLLVNSVGQIKNLNDLHVAPSPQIACI